MGQKCEDCGLQFKSPHAKQYEDCNHLYMKDVNHQYVCVVCRSIEEYREEIKASNKCVHKRFEYYLHGPFCHDCGLEITFIFPPSRYRETQTLIQKKKALKQLGDKQWESLFGYGNKPIPVKKLRLTKTVFDKSKEPKKGGKPKKGEPGGDCKPEEGGYDFSFDNEPEKGEQDYRYFSDDDEKPVKKRRKNNNPPPPPKNDDDGPLNEYSKVSDLRKEAAIRGIKYISRMSKEKLGVKH